jgi:hypothetical protein
LLLEPITDDISEEIIGKLQNDSDDRSCSSTEEEKRDEDDGVFSGTEAL